MYFRSTTFLEGGIECRSASAVVGSYDEHSSFSNPQNNTTRKTASIAHGLVELEMLYPIASPFPDAKRSKSHKSLFATPPRTPTVGHRERKSERGFKKTKGTLGEKETKYDIAAYLREDEDAFFMEKPGSPTAGDNIINDRIEPIGTSRQLIKQIFLKKKLPKNSSSLKKAVEI